MSASTWIIQDENGTFLKRVPSREGTEIHFHELFGWVGASALHERIRNRRLKGLKANTDVKCSFRIAQDGANWALEAVYRCSVARVSDSNWVLRTGAGSFQIRSDSEGVGALSVPASISDKNQRLIALWGILGFLFLSFSIFTALWKPATVVEEKLPEPVEVKIVEEKAVVVPKPVIASTDQKNLATKSQAQEVKRAIQQDLGFLGLLGKKDLKKALGGAPSRLSDASPGAGAGGKDGSGGEVLVGLGQGVKRVSVGNSGVQGLGGIGTKGAGGGAGGYGDAAVGSGNGKGLSAIPFSEQMVLEGGLDRSAIQATIAKYLNEVRACYEIGLKNHPALSGQVTMSFEVSGSGSLNYSRVAKSTLGNDEVGSCIANRMMGWKFPKPRGGVNVKVNYPFLLRPVSAGA